MPQLNEKIVAAAKPPETGQRFVRDSLVTGLSLRVGATGAKSWMLTCRIKGRPRRFTLGGCPALTVAAARAMAMKKKAQIAAGGDPIADRRAERAEMTWAEFREEYMARHSRPFKRSTGDDVATMRRYVPAAWNARRLSDITSSEVAQLHISVGANHGHCSANGLIRLLHAMFNKAIKWSKLPKGSNPSDGIEFFHENHRKRFLNNEELGRVLTALTAEPNEYWRSYFMLLLMEGTRCSELLSARWADFNFDAREWHIPDTKAKRPHDLPLPDPAIDLLRALPSFGTNEFVFPGRGKTGHLAEPKKAWARIRTAAKVKNIWVHDLRRTLGSRLVNAGYSLPLIAKVLNHSQLSTTEIYAHLSLDPQREALEANATALLELMPAE
jgi:integrase